MGKLIYSMFVLLDGFVETSDGGLDWSTPDTQLHRFVNIQARDLVASLYGRRLYELMVDHWPTVEDRPENPRADVDFARIWRATPKIVFSRTLEQADWGSRLIRKNAVEEVFRLKQDTEGDMDVGGPTLAAELIRHGLVDEYRMYRLSRRPRWRHTVLPGAGNPLDLRLVEAHTFDSGVVYLRHRV